MSEILKTILTEQTLSEVVDRYFATKDTPQESMAGNRYRLFAERLNATRFVLPVAGVQGSGKSSLLNSIAFKSPILPIDADETTCVPVEIRWAACPEGKALIVYQDGRQEYIQASEEQLAAFVHNGNNAGNEKRVDRVILESDNEMLKSGIVLVDLPGTGSLTSANMETTRRYLDESVGAIFMLRTVPPLTQSESVFISLQWGRLPTAFFVQNRWNDETNEEANSGRDHNIVVLKEIAARNHLALSGNPVVYVVNAYKAVEGSLKSSDEIIRSSGLQEFTSALEDFGNKWPIMVERSIALAVLNDLYSTKQTIDNDISLLTADKGKILDDLKSEQKRFDEYIGIVREKQIAWEKMIDEEVKKQSNALSAWAKKATSELRNEMRTKIHAGIVDGPRLERALRDEERRHYDDIIVSVEESMLSLQDHMRDLLKDVSGWRMQKNPRLESVSTEEKTKYENLAPRLLGIGGSVVGGAAGTAAGTIIAAGSFVGYANALAGGLAAAGKTVAIVSAAFPAVAVGIVVAGVVGALLVGWLGSKAGDKTREFVTEKRGEEVRPIVFSAIDKFADQTEKDLTSHILKLQADMTTALQSWTKSQVSAFETERNKREDALKTGTHDKETKITAYQKDLTSVVAYIKRLELEGVDG